MTTDPASNPLAGLLDDVVDALLWFDARGLLQQHNSAARKLLGGETGQPAAQFLQRLGEGGTAWLQGSLRSPRAGETTITLADGRRLRLLCRPLAPGWGLRVTVLGQGTGHPPAQAPAAAPAHGPQSAPPTVGGVASGAAASAPPATVPAAGPAQADSAPLATDSPAPAEAGPVGVQGADAATWAMLRLLWASALPVALQGPGQRLVDVNEACAAALGRGRDSLRGLDVIELQPPEDRAVTLAQRQDPEAMAARARDRSPSQRRFLDGEGRVRWFSVQAQPLHAPGSPALWLVLLQDQSSEHRARDQARRAQDEAQQWFELSRAGLLIYDEHGLIVRSNAALEALLEQVPALLDEAPAALQALLAWEGGGPHSALAPGAPPLETRVVLTLPSGQQRLLGARLSGWLTDHGQRRVMAVVEDHSAEDERDRAQHELALLMDMAAVNVATFDPLRGWLSPHRAPQREAAQAWGADEPERAPDIVGHADRHGDGQGGGTATGDGAGDGDGDGAGDGRGDSALQGISRDLVEPESLADYEQLQQALRQGHSANVLYAVRHPRLGRRWLRTRVQPNAAEAPGGRHSISVVTSDVTERERARGRSDQLLRELTTILDVSTAGIAYLRGPVLVRCNLRFERMLGFAPGAAAGASLDDLLRHQPNGAQVLAEATAALNQGRPFETELMAGQAQGQPLWYSLSVRRAENTEGGVVEAVAVLTDISRLKSQQSELETLVRDRELMFSLSDVGIVYLRGARVERANQAMARLTGYAPPELTALDPAELYDNARECVAFEAQVAQALRHQGRFSGERRLRRRDATLIWVQVAVRPVDPDQPEAGTICSFVDVDERHRARESLAVQAERTRAILNSVLVGIVTVGEHGIDWMNRSARRMFAGELADFVGEPISIVATPEPEHPLRRSDYLHRLHEGQAETFECRLKARDGREFWVVGNAVVTGPEGGHRQLTFALLDIERRRQAEVTIAQAQESLQRVIETAPLAIALFDARSLRVQQVNQMASSFFAMPIERVLGQPLVACCSEAKAEAVGGWLQAAAADGQLHQHEWREAPAEGNEPPRVWDTRIVPLPAAGHGGLPQLLLVASDVTEQRAAEQARLQAAIAQREVLVREVHHRIKNNLQGVAGLLQQNAVRHPEVATMLGEAVSQVQAIAQVYGLQVGSAGPLRVARVVEAITQSVQRTFGRSIRFSSDGSADRYQLPEAEAIPIALTLNELLTNAVKHSPQGEVQCTLHADTATGEVTVTLRNQGGLRVGFDVSRVPGGVSGLGLVRALLPRRSASLAMRQDGDDVLTVVALRAPSVLPVDEA
ncbi:MAG: PAS domain S-box protein [Rubrivivax sp.]